MAVLLLIVGLLVLVATVYVALGRGGELSRERADYAPLDLGPVSAADVALLRPPSNGWGYNKEATDEALDRIAESVRERDVRIVALEQLVTDLSRDPAPVALGDPLPGARHRRAVAPAEPGVPAVEPAAEAGDTAEEEASDAESEAPGPSAPGVWPTAPAESDAAAEETTQPQPAVREPSDAGSAQPQRVRSTGERQQKPPPERSHG